MATYVYLPPCEGKPAQCQVKPNGAGSIRTIPWSEAERQIAVGDILVKDALVQQKGLDGEFHGVNTGQKPVSLSPTRREGHGGRHKKKR